MKRFAALYETLDRTTSTNEKVAALAGYFAAAPPEDAAWAVWFLTGRRLKRLLGARLLAGWAMAESGVPDWLFEESYAGVGDLAETVALLLDRDGALSSPGAGGPGTEIPLHAWVEDRLLLLRKLTAEEQRTAVVGWWRQLGRWETFVLNKLLTGALRVGVSQTLVERALARIAGVPQAVLAHRLMGDWEPTPTFFRSLVRAEGEGGALAADSSQPYPFYLASPLDQPLAALGDPAAWQLEWKWDGIRAQLLRRAGAVYLWSRGEELITERFPEIARAALSLLPDGSVLDGEILAWRDGRPLPFAVLQRRIGRKSLSEKILAEAPAVFLAYDLLEDEGRDLRGRPLAERRAKLASRLELGRPVLLLSPQLAAPSWPAAEELRGAARARGVEGLMLKSLASPYGAGRRRGDWWKWKIEPYHFDAVLLYAQAGHGRRANLLTDYTFGVWSEGALVTIAKAYSGLADPEILALDGWIRKHTVQKFGPVRSVEPVQVFEIACEGIAPSPRHRSGLAVRFPRIARWRTDKRPEDADTLEQVRGLAYGLL